MKSSEGYWNKNLDPQNLSRAKDAALETELAFLQTPEWLWATERLRLPLERIASYETTVPAAPPKSPLLDLGAGLGSTTLTLAKAGRTVVAADPAPARLKAIQDAACGRDLSRRVWPVVMRAEALPFKAGALSGVFTKSVLIHTRLPEAAAELQRTLAPGAAYGIIEPLDRNPLVCLYRATLAPKEWKEFTIYFDHRGEREKVLTDALGGSESRRWYVFAFAAYVFQYGVAWPFLFRLALRALLMVDRLLQVIVPPLHRRWAWFTVLRGRIPETRG